MITLSPFKISSGEFLKILVRLYLSKMWWIYLLPTILLAILAIIDIRFILVSLMAAFIIIPMILLLVYFNYGLQPENRYSILNKNVEIDSEFIKMHIYEPDGNSENIAIDWNEIGAYTPLKEHILLRYKIRNYVFIAFPYSAFANKEQLISLIDIMKGNNINCR